MSLYLKCWEIYYRGISQVFSELVTLCTSIIVKTLKRGELCFTFSCKLLYDQNCPHVLTGLVNCGV